MMAETGTISWHLSSMHPKGHPYPYLPSSLFKTLPFSTQAERRRRANLSWVLGYTLDRVNVLGDDHGYGHTGCVNALSWARNGDILLSGGDDTTVRLWRMETSDTIQDYPFMSHCVINTGHRANIFSAQMLPQSSRIATAAGDTQVRVFDVQSALAPTNVAQDLTETVLSTNQSCIRVIRCHSDRVKRVVVEESSDLFLSLSEDGTVRQHDLRTSHSCRGESCPTPLVEIGHELSTISLSPLTPYQLVVAGRSPYGYLYDRRHLPRTLKQEWGLAPRSGKELTTCVRKFGRKRLKERQMRPDHITGCRMSSSNGHEVVLSYSDDGVYLFSTKDEENHANDMSKSPVTKSANLMHVLDIDAPEHERTSWSAEPSEPFSALDVEDGEPGMPIVMPRRRYTGSRNIATVKDVNFLGPEDEWVTSGSDDGNFFVWEKSSGRLHGIYEGDSSVVNMVEGHPHLPLVAVSGIDTTIKLFSPTSSSSAFSKMAQAQEIMENNQRTTTTRFTRYNIGALLAEARIASGGEPITVQIPECVGQ
ncbi:unnamed protein product [Cyclocybe aegerita]|uniref:WD40 repeat-like protein n=1 Tax=Cyclocybe aegerita TaxID=1973307 RepID=A0A8S0W762_CYCAE|nr:unnamed protein product [Cyclocybe aegerita]